MIPGLPQIGGMELLILLTVVVLFFGAKRIPDLARSIGKGTREFREGIRESSSDEARDREEKDEEKPALEGADHSEAPRAEKVGATHADRES